MLLNSQQTYAMIVRRLSNMSAQEFQEARDNGELEGYMLIISEIYKYEIEDERLAA